MAIETNIVSTRMQLKLNTGLDQEGKEIIRTKTYSNVKAEADNQNIFDVASSLASLQEHGLHQVHRVDDIILTKID